MPEFDKETLGLPWRAGTLLTHVMQGSTGAVCKFESIHGMYDNYKRNCEFLVQAANDWHALRDLLREVQRWLQNYYCHGDGDTVRRRADLIARIKKVVDDER